MIEDLQINDNKYFDKLYKEQNILCMEQKKDIESKFSDNVQDDLFSIEDTSWWFPYRAAVVYQLAQTFFDNKKFTFDLGGGNGYTTFYMQDKGFPMILVEPSFGACKNAKKRGVQTVICGTFTQENIKEESIDQVLLLDVLEHIEKDAEFLKMIHQKLVKKGKILITVPAFSLLWSSEDDAAGHYRRYRLKQIHTLAKEAGFSVLYSTYFFEFLFLPILLVRVGMEKMGLLKRKEERTEEEKKKIAQKQFQKRRGISQIILQCLEKIECDRIKKKKKIRFGSSILCVLEKK